MLLFSEKAVVFFKYVVRLLFSCSNSSEDNVELDLETKVTYCFALIIYGTFRNVCVYFEFPNVDFLPW